MKKGLTLILLILATVSLMAQNRRIVVKSFSKSEVSDMRARTSPVLDNNRKLAALIDISFAAPDSVVAFEGIVGDPVHYPGEWLVYVPEGTERIKISLPDCKPKDFEFPAGLRPESGVVYRLDLDIEESVKNRTLVMPTASMSFTDNSSANGPHFSYGLMLGLCKRNGGYIKVKSDFVFGLETTAECDVNGVVGGVQGWFDGESKMSRSAVTAGYMRHLFNVGEKSSFYGFVGGGYGQRTLAWHMYGKDGEYEWVKVAPGVCSFSGYELELGAIFRAGGFAFSAGVQTNGFKYFEANVGVGLMF